jgi:hypothetical protein
MNNELNAIIGLLALAVGKGNTLEWALAHYCARRGGMAGNVSDAKRPPQWKAATL